MKNVIFFFILYTSSLRAQDQKSDLTELIQPSVFAITRVMMHDVVNPPAASRYYAYCMMGAYEMIASARGSAPSLNALVKDKPVLPAPKPANVELAAVFCILESGRRMLPSGYMIEKDLAELIAKLKKQKVPVKIIDESMAAAIDMSQQVIRYAAADGYGKLSARLRYTPIKGEGYWYPTPPAYLEAVEPNWKTVRPLLIDSCNQFVPPRPIMYSADSASDFYRLASEVYHVSSALTAQQLHIASFWDCNPFAIENAGHLALGFKKISPGGHWMNIAGIAARKAKLDFSQTIILHTMVGITLMDAFISCWDEKYRSHRIRPETYINKRINVRWQPLLQTPPFPEYPSGHSVVSSAAAEVLTYFLGDHFNYTDDSELMFEIPARSFTSFRQAAQEAAISRLYGGIHFRDAIENGQIEGRQIGAAIVNKLRTAGMKRLIPD